MQHRASLYTCFLCVVLCTLISSYSSQLFNSYGAYDMPGQIHVSFTGKADEASIMWVGGEPEDNRYHVQYGYESERQEMSVSAVAKPYSSTPSYRVVMYEAILKDLQPNKKIFYRIVEQRKNIATKEFHFYSAQEVKSHNPQYPFGFLSYGDMDTGFDAQNTIKRINDQLQNDTIRFIIHQGDIPYAYSEDKWDTWGKLIEHVSGNTVYMVCPGNHESNYDFKSYKSRFSSLVGVNSRSNSNLYYSFDYLNIHFVALSSEHPYTPDSEQYKWLKRDLESVKREVTPFVILFAHRPMYSSNKNHGSDVVFRQHIEPLFAEHNVNLVLLGHVHAYERTCPLVNGNCIKTKPFSIFDGSGTIQVVSGTAGYELNEDWEKPKPRWSTYRETFHGFLRVMVHDRFTLQVQSLRNDDLSIADDFTIQLK